MEDSTKVYNNYAPEFLNKDDLIKEEDFIDDAVYFLIDRGGYTLDEIDTDEKVYDAYMEHFRYQNVNEITALKDFTAPSTYAGMFSFGAGKVGALAAQQGIKLGIREAIKKGGVRSALGSVAVDAPAAVGTVAAQESVRVDTGIKDEIDMTNIALAGGLSTVASGGIGLYTGTKRALTSAGAERIAMATEKKIKVRTEIANKRSVAVLSDDATKDMSNDFLDAVEEGVKKEKVKKLSLGETIPEELAEGVSLRTKNLNDAGKTLEQMEIENIAAAGAKIDNLIPDLPDLPKGKIERFTSRLTWIIYCSSKRSCR
mgnify:CR=1 FL=1